MRLYITVLLSNLFLVVSCSQNVVYIPTINVSRLVDIHDTSIFDVDTIMNELRFEFNSKTNKSGLNIYSYDRRLGEGDYSRIEKTFYGKGTDLVNVETIFTTNDRERYDILMDSAFDSDSEFIYSGREYEGEKVIYTFSTSFFSERNILYLESTSFQGDGGDSIYMVTLTNPVGKIIFESQLENGDSI